MADLASTGPMSAALDALKTLLSNVMYFQTWTHTANATDAAERIFIGEIGVPVATVAVSADVMTVTLREPSALTVGQAITLEGAAIGEEGVSVAGTFAILSLGAFRTIEWTDENGNVWLDGSGNPWTYVSDEVLSFTCAVDLPDLTATPVDGVVLLPCARPFALLSDADGDPIHGETNALGSPIVGGAMDLMLEARVSRGYRNNPRNAMIEARNAFGSILLGLNELSGQGDFIQLNRVETAVPPQFIDTAEQNDTAGRFEKWRALIRVTWGLNG